jgi:hypothetical protein
LQLPQSQQQQQTEAAQMAAADVEPVSQHMVNPVDPDMPSGEPVLSADELRALLQEEPSLPPDTET